MSRPGEPQGILVVIPARDEQERLPACLAAVQAAAAQLTPASPPVRVVVVLDSCTDASAEIVRRTSWVDAVSADLGAVGAARALGIERGLAELGAAGGRRWNWIACTDADTLVPTDWLRTHLAAARTGVDLLLGTVRPDEAELAPSVLSRWLGRHQFTDGHPHIHGANMGVRSDTYRRAGGFAPIAEHEDVRLVERVRALGARVMSTGASPVLTSGRLIGRTPGGMAGYLLALGGVAVLEAREPS